MADRPLSGREKFATIIAQFLNDLPTTSPHGSYSDTMQEICVSADPAEIRGTATTHQLEPFRSGAPVYFKATKMKVRPLPTKGAAFAHFCASRCDLGFRGLLSVKEFVVFDGWLEVEQKIFVEIIVCPHFWSWGSWRHTSLAIGDIASTLICGGVAE